MRTAGKQTSPIAGSEGEAPLGKSLETQPRGALCVPFICAPAGGVERGPTEEEPSLSPETRP